MSVSPLTSPLWMPQGSFRTQDSISLNPVSPKDHQAWDHSWSSRESSENRCLREPPATAEVFETRQPGDTSTKSTRKDKWKQIARDWWAEMAWLTFSAICLGTVAVGLFIMDGKPLSVWRFSIALNAVVSALVVAAKAALIYTTACCVGQLKWHHFQQRHPRSLHDLKTFDEASKGPLGALKLVMKVGIISPVAILGSVVILCAVFMEPFGQQILAYPTRDVALNDSVAALPIAHRLAAQPSWYLDYTTMSDLQKLLLSAIFRGDTSPAFDCSTSSCTWPAFSTLGICSTCRDITSISNGSCRGDARSLDCQYVTPRGAELGGRVEPGGPMPLINTSTVDGVYDALPSFYNFSTLVVAESTDWMARLTECELSWCAWTYENATSQGTDIRLENSRQFPLRFGGTWEKTNDTSNLVDTQSVCTAMGSYPSDLNNTFTISQSKEYFLKYATRLILKAGYQGADFYTQLTLATSSLDYEDTMAMSSNLAAFMTNALRTQDDMQFIGTAWQSVTFIQVRWVWLLLPAVVVLAAAFVLYLTIIQSTRHQTVLWKSSLLAFLFCSARSWNTTDDVRVDRETSSLGFMETVSKKVDARLERDAEGRYQLVQA